MPYKEVVSIDEVLALLNELLEKDPAAIVPLVQYRVFCNKATADHPTVQVLNKDGVDYVGMLGILNGLFGVNDQGFGVLAIEMDEKTLEFQRFVRLDKLEKDSGGQAPSHKRKENGPDMGSSSGAE